MKIRLGQQRSRTIATSLKLRKQQFPFLEQNSLEIFVKSHVNVEFKSSLLIYLDKKTLSIMFPCILEFIPILAKSPYLNS